MTPSAPYGLTESLAIVRVRRSLTGLEVSFETEQIEAPTRCRARKRFVRTREATMGEEKGCIVSVGAQGELNVTALPGRVRDPPPRARDRIELFDDYLAMKRFPLNPNSPAAPSFGSIAASRVHH